MIFAIPNEDNLRNWPENEGQVIEVLNITGVSFEGTMLAGNSFSGVGYYSDSWIRSYYNMHDSSLKITIPLIL